MENLRSIEQTLVLIKPDAIRRGIVGDIIGRFEKAALTIVAMEMIHATKQQIERHFPQTKSSTIHLGQKLLLSYYRMRIDPLTFHANADPYFVGLDLQASIARYFESGPMIRMVLSGYNVVARVREMVGDTLPFLAAAGTIRGDYSLGETVENTPGRACINMVHASESVSEARREITAWFDVSELCDFVSR